MSPLSCRIGGTQVGDQRAGGDDGLVEQCLDVVQRWFSLVLDLGCGQAETAAETNQAEVGRYQQLLEVIVQHLGQTLALALFGQGEFRGETPELLGTTLEFLMGVAQCGLGLTCGLELLALEIVSARLMGLLFVGFGEKPLIHAFREASAWRWLDTAALALIITPSTPLRRPSA